MLFRFISNAQDKGQILNKYKKKLNRELKNLSQTSFQDFKNIWTLLKT